MKKVVYYSFTFNTIEEAASWLTLNDSFNNEKGLEVVVYPVPFLVIDKTEFCIVARTLTNL